VSFNFLFYLFIYFELKQPFDALNVDIICFF